MAPKVFQVLLYAFLFLFLILFHATIAIGEIPSSPSGFDFIKPLQGSKKGDKVKGLYNLKKYLERFGYIDDLPYNSNSPRADYFSDQLESAIKTYQTNFHLNSTGELDAATVSQMIMPRCGFPDIINGTNWMQRAFSAGPQYTFLPGKPKWPDDKHFFLYGWAPGTPAKFHIPLAIAFGHWRNVANFIFKRTHYDKAVLKFQLFSRDHGDGFPFDGRGGTYAHSFPPRIGVCHFDADENWVDYGPPPYGLDIESIAVHEIGHLLGLGHSTVPEAIMWPYIRYGVKKTVLTYDDIQGIRALYPGHHLNDNFLSYNNVTINT